MARVADLPHADRMTEPAPVRRRPPPTPEELRLRAEGLWPFIPQAGRLAKLPAKSGRRIHVLQHVAESFDADSTYDEIDVNDVLGRWCEGGEVDHVTVRRYLIDYGLMTRRSGSYRRVVE